MWFVSSQVFDNTPAALDGTLAAGDEITGVNGKPVKGKTKVEVAKMIQAVQVHAGNEMTQSTVNHRPEQHQDVQDCKLIFKKSNTY